MRKLFIIPACVLLLFSCRKNKSEFDASGVFEATEVIVSAEATGRILRFDIQEGQTVAVGDILGYIDTIQLHLNRVQLLASGRAVESRLLDTYKQIASTQEQIAAQERERDRTERLIAANAANTKQLDDINSAIRVLEKQLAAQRATLESSNRSISEEGSAVSAQIAQVEDLISRSMITSPIDGTILAKYAEAGEMTSTGRALFKVADIGNIILRAYITAGQLTQIRVGQQVRVFADYGDKGRREYEGTVSWVSDKAEFTPKTIQTRDERANLVYAVKITVKNDGLIKIGMYGDVKFE